MIQHSAARFPTIGQVPQRGRLSLVILGRLPPSQLSLSTWPFNVSRCGWNGRSLARLTRPRESGRGEACPPFPYRGSYLVIITQLQRPCPAVRPGRTNASCVLSCAAVIKTAGIRKVVLPPPLSNTRGWGQEGGSGQICDGRDPVWTRSVGHFTRRR